MNILPLSYSCSIFLYIVSVSSTRQLKLQRACISMALYNKVVTVSAKFVVENTDTRGDEINSLYHTDILEDCKRFQEREKKTPLIIRHSKLFKRFTGRPVTKMVSGGLRMGLMSIPVMRHIKTTVGKQWIREQTWLDNMTNRWANTHLYAHRPTHYETH